MDIIHNVLFVSEFGLECASLITGTFFIDLFVKLDYYIFIYNPPDELLKSNTITTG